MNLRSESVRDFLRGAPYVLGVLAVVTACCLVERAAMVAAILCGVAAFVGISMSVGEEIRREREWRARKQTDEAPFNEG